MAVGPSAGRPRRGAPLRSLLPVHQPGRRAAHAGGGRRPVDGVGGRLLRLPWPRASSPPSSASCSTAGRGPRGAASTPRRSTSSRLLQPPAAPLDARLDGLGLELVGDDRRVVGPHGLPSEGACPSSWLSTEPGQLQARACRHELCRLYPTQQGASRHTRPTRSRLHSTSRPTPPTAAWRPCR